MNNIKRALLVIMIVLSITSSVGMASSDRPKVAVELETIENTQDICIACGCQLKGELEQGKKNTWWFSFGVVKTDAKKGWEVSAIINSLRSTAMDPRQSILTPINIRGHNGPSVQEQTHG